MALDKQDIAALVEALRAPDARTLAVNDARIAEHKAKRDELKKGTKKTKKQHFFRVPALAYVSGIGLVGPGTKHGDIVALSRKQEPSHTWEAVKTQAEIDAAAAEAAVEPDTDEPDELDTKKQGRAADRDVA